MIMVLFYKFKKDRLDDGSYVARPRILVELAGERGSILIPALIDSGSDTTVIPYGIAASVGLSTDGPKDKLYAYRESSEVVHSKAKITFLGKEQRQSVTLPAIPILVTLPRADSEEEEDIVLGLDGVFEAFDVTFKKAENKIILKPAIKNYFSRKR